MKLESDLIYVTSRYLDKKDIKLQDVFFAFYKDKNIFIIKKDDLL